MEGQCHEHRWYEPQEHEGTEKEGERERELVTDGKVMEKGVLMSTYLDNVACDNVCL